MYGGKEMVQYYTITTDPRNIKCWNVVGVFIAKSAKADSGITEVKAKTSDDSGFTLKIMDRDAVLSKYLCNGRRIKIYGRALPDALKEISVNSLSFITDR